MVRETKVQVDMIRFSVPFFLPARAGTAYKLMKIRPRPEAAQRAGSIAGRDRTGCPGRDIFAEQTAGEIKIRLKVAVAELNAVKDRRHAVANERLRIRDEVVDRSKLLRVEVGKVNRAEQALRLAETDLDRMLGWRKPWEGKPWTEFMPLTVADGLPQMEYEREVERYRLLEELLEAAGMSLEEFNEMVR